MFSIQSASYYTYSSDKFKFDGNSKEAYVLYCLRYGSATFASQRKFFRGAPNDCFLFRKNLPHSATCTSPKEVKFYQICFVSTDELVIHEPHITANLATSLAVKRCFEQYNYGNPLQAESWLAAAVSEFCNPTLFRDRIDTEIIHTLCLYIDSHISQNVTLKELCDISGYSPNYITRIFNKELGCSPHKYILEFRCRRAQNLLAYTSKNIAAIAAETGFNDTAHFSKYFKLATGLTPSQYRMKYCP